MTKAKRASVTGRSRRKPDELRQAFIEAALKLFSDRGYARTTTREIADSAKSSEVVLFRYFGSKANLFREAVVLPFESSLRAFLARYSPGEDDQPFESSPEFVEMLFQILMHNKNIMLSLVTTTIYETGEAEQQMLSSPFRDYFKLAMEQLNKDYQKLAVPPDEDSQLFVRFAFSAVVATALFKDWILSDLQLDDAKIVNGLSRFILNGLGVNPDLT